MQARSTAAAGRRSGRVALGAAAAAVAAWEAERLEEGERVVVRAAEAAPLGGDGSDDEGALVCTTCLAAFEGLDEHRDHYRGPWHRANLRRVLAGRARLTAEQWEDGDGGADAEGGEDGVAPAERDDRVSAPRGRGAGAATVTLAGPAGRLSLWKCLLFPRRVAADSLEAALEAARALGRAFEAGRAPRSWAVLLCQGGSFSGAVYETAPGAAGGAVPGWRCVEHKTMHRYTVRRKQGGSQASKDSQSGTSAPKSAGSSLRRYNQARLAEDVSACLAAWRGTLAACDLVFLHAPSANRALLVGDAPPLLAKDDARARPVPFVVRKINFSENQRVLRELATVVMLDADEAAAAAAGGDDGPAVEEEADAEEDEEEQKEEAAPAEERDDPARRALREATARAVRAVELDDGVQLACEVDAAATSGADEEDVAAALGEVAHAAAGLGRAALLRGLAAGAAGAAGCVGAPDPAWNLGTPLHRAAAGGHAAAVRALLEAGADPTARNFRKQTPYDMAGGKEARHAIRAFAAEHPGRWDYAAASIPPAEDADAAAARAAAQRAKKKDKERRRRQRKAQEKAEARERQERAEAEARAKAEIKAAEERRTREVAGMSDRERRARALELRLGRGNGTGPRCGLPSCGKAIVTVPFERLEYKYCSMPCLRAHRAELS